MDELALFLAPFLSTMGSSQSFQLRERIKSTVFMPLLESNTT
jgi:hypothetical protein